LKKVYFLKPLDNFLYNFRPVCLQVLYLV